MILYIGVIYMTDLRLTVYTGLDSIYDGFISKISFPEGVTGKTAVIPANLRIKKKEASLFITDDVQKAEMIAKKKRTGVFLVYCGPFSEASAFADALDELWDTKDENELLLRCSWLLDKIKRIFDEWFYRNTMLTTIDSVPDMLWYKRIDGIHMLVNNAFTEIVHKPKSDIHGKDHFYIWNAPRPTDEGGNDFACAQSEEIAISSGKTYICDEPVKTREGMKQFTTYKTPVYDMLGNVFGTVGIGHDVTNFSNLGIELDILTDSIPFPMVIFSSGWEVVKMNSEFKAVAGIKKVNKSFSYQSWKKKNLIAVGAKKTIKKNHSTVQEFMYTDSSGTKYFSVTELEIRDYFDNVSGHFVLMLDITYQRVYEQSIISAANTDILTGIFNRRYFYSYMSENISKPMILLYMDLDRFKDVNDEYGHAKGDEVLIDTAEFIRRFFPDDIFARVGGDEFVVAADLGKADIVKKSASALEKAIEKHFSSEGLNVTISIGIAQTDNSYKNVDDFIHDADKRMYEKKREHHKKAKSC